jgi:hypothetical protein
MIKLWCQDYTNRPAKRTSKKSQQEKTPQEKNSAKTKTQGSLF